MGEQITPSSPIDRRQFLATSLKLGVAAAALGLTETGANAWASDLDADRVLATPAPKEAQTFVSRPDIVPPGVSLARSPGYSSEGLPTHIFLAPHVVAGSTQPRSSAGLMILDLDGQLVWWHPMPPSEPDPFNFQVQTYRGKPVLTWYQGLVAPEVPIVGTAVIADDTYTEIKTVRAVKHGTDPHEFRITPEDTALLTAYQSGRLVVNHAQEISIGPNRLLWDWSSYPAVTPAASSVGLSDYFHMNSIDLWPGRERNVLISSRNTSTVYLVSRATKRIIWRLGGVANSFSTGPGALFSYQHDARPLADGSGLSLFDNATAGDPGLQYAESQSWGKVFHLDQKTNQLTLRHEFNHRPTKISSSSQGNCQLLPNGGHFVGWGDIPSFSLYAPAVGEALQPPLLLDGRLPAGLENYRAFLFDWTGRPAESELVIVVHPGSSPGWFTAYTSWNGATDVSFYKISAGRSSSPQRTVATKGAGGFETVIHFAAHKATDFQVSAFDSKRALLGRSTVVGVTA